MENDFETQGEEFNNTEAQNTNAENVNPQSEDNDNDVEERMQQLEAELAKYKRMAEQKTKKLEQFKSGNAPSKKTNNGEFDYGQKAFLVAKGYSNSDEWGVIQEAMTFTGKSLEDVLSNKYVLSEINALREAKASADAIPSSSKRAGVSSKTQVDYWIQKGELPPADQVMLRRQVVNARLAASKQKSKFGA